MGGVTKFLALLSIVALGVGCNGGASERVSQESKSQSLVQREKATGDATKVDHIVISKESLRLRVYDSDNRLISSFGVAIGRGEGDKREVGDMCTPEGEFTIASIEPSADWLYDSGDGVVEGYYGDWFLRLSSQFKGIGIYGTADNSIIGTRSTEGSIRLASSDLDSLYTLVRKGMKVRIDATDVRVVEARAVITNDKSQEMVAEVVASDAVADEASEVAHTESVAPAKDAGAGGNEVWHKVADGELLGRIAMSYGTTVAEIKRLNPQIDVDRISIGQRILISDGSTPVRDTSVSQGSASKVVEKDGEVWYTLQDGDLVGRVAMRHGTTSKRIAELNPDINIDKVRSGQRIRIK